MGRRPHCGMQGIDFARHQRDRLAHYLVPGPVQVEQDAEAWFTKVTTHVSDFACQQLAPRAGVGMGSSYRKSATCTVLANEWGAKCRCDRARRWGSASA